MRKQVQQASSAPYFFSPFLFPLIIIISDPKFTKCKTFTKSFDLMFRNTKIMASLYLNRSLENYCVSTKNTITLFFSVLKVPSL